MLYNGHPLIVKPLAPRYSQSNNAVLAGPKPSNFTKEVSGKQEALLTDPWAKYNPTTTASAASAVAPQHREVSGPTQKKFQEQDAKLEVLEKQIASLRQDTKQGIDKLQADQEQSHKQLTSAMQTMKQEIDVSVAQAMKQQSTQLEGTLKELKDLFLEKTKKSENKRPAEITDMDL